MITAEIRDIIEGDAEQLLSLWRATWTSTYGPSLGMQALTEMLDELDRDGLSRMLPGNGERGFCAVSEGEIVGSLVVVERGQRAYIWGLYIRPECQKAGFGSKLLAAAVGGLSPEIQVEVRVLVTSGPAMFFYRKHGFVEIGTEQGELPGNVPVSTVVMAVSAEDLRRALAART